MSLVTLYPFQQEGVRLIKLSDLRTLLADDMGLGKTVQALKCLVDLPELRPALIVCPANVKPIWRHQAAQHLNMRVEELSSRTPPVEGLYKPKVAVINYEILVHWEEYLKRMKLKLIIWDECHYLQNLNAKRTATAMRLSKKAPHLIFMSGTPLTNKITELFPILHMLAPKKFPNPLRFAFRYTWPRKTPFGWDFSRVKKNKLKRLHIRLKEAGLMIRRTKEEVLKDLPAKRKIVVPIELKGRKEYDLAERDFKGWLRQNTEGGGLPKRLKQEAGVKVQALKRLAANLKLPNVIAWVNDFMANSDEKLALFVIHKAVVAELKKAFPKAAVVTGDVTGTKRETEFDRFNKLKGCRLFIGNIHAAGTGWSALDCSTTAAAELAWKPGDHDQADDRVRGIGRGREGVAATNYYLIAGGTVEERICRLHDQKRKTINLVLNGEVGDDEDIMDMLIAEMAK